MINFDDATKENIKEHNPNWPQIPDHPFRMLINGGSGSRKTNSLLNLINRQSDIDKIRYDINREAPKILTLSSGKINKYEYLKGEEILHFTSRPK